MITRSREGLTGGVAGFFQKQFVEVEARARGCSVGRVDDSTPLPDSFQSAVRSPTVHSPEPGQSPVTSHQSPEPQPPVIQRILQQAAPFADQLRRLSSALRLRRAPAMAPLWRASGFRPLRWSRRGLAAAGLHPALADGIVTETVSHMLPVSPHFCSSASWRDAGAPHPGQSTWSRRGRTVGFVGTGRLGQDALHRTPGRGLRARQRPAGDLHVPAPARRRRGADRAARSKRRAVHPVQDPGEARARIAGARDHALIVIDTPTVSPAAPTRWSAWRPTSSASASTRCT